MLLNLYLLKSLYKGHLENEKGALIQIVFMNGYCIKKGNIGLLHLHNRIMILNEDKDSYCRMIGRGLMIMGLGALISSLLSACLNNENYLFILLASSAIGVTMCYYAVFKYNMYRKIQS